VTGIQYLFEVSSGVGESAEVVACLADAKQPATTRRRPATSSAAAAYRRNRPQGRQGPDPGRAALAVERTNAWHNNFNRLQRCHERKEEVIDAFFDLADTIITVRRLIRESWTFYRRDGPPGKTTMINAPIRTLS
jgi:hypothetical protein